MAGDLNDQWTAYDFYKQEGQHSKAEQAAATVNASWATLRDYQERNVTLLTVVDHLVASLNVDCSLAPPTPGPAPTPGKALNPGRTTKTAEIVGGVIGVTAVGGVALALFMATKRASAGAVGAGAAAGGSDAASKPPAHSERLLVEYLDETNT